MVEVPGEVRAHLRGFRITDKRSPTLATAAAIFPSFRRTRRLDIAEAALQAWVTTADYATAGPAWWKLFGKIHLRKMLLHYASVDLANIQKGGVYLDAGASVSPFHQVIRHVHGAKLCYRQDLSRAPGLHGDGIGGDAAAIPLPDASLDGIVAHEAWAHFEGENAMDFLREASRLLKPGARLCAVPVIFAERTEILTSPSVWSTKYRQHPEPPLFDRRATIVIDPAMAQRQILRWQPTDLAEALTEVEGMDFEIVQVVFSGKSQFALVGTRV